MILFGGRDWQVMHNKSGAATTRVSSTESKRAIACTGRLKLFIKA